MIPLITDIHRTGVKMKIYQQKRDLSIEFVDKKPEKEKQSGKTYKDTIR